MNNKFNRDGEPFTQDNPDESNVWVSHSLSELIDMIDQKLENKPKGEKRFDIWRGEVNNLVSEINSRADRKMYLSV